MKVWLIEDDGFKRDKLRSYLAATMPGVEILLAKSAKSAFNLLSGGMPDLIVLDMSLPTFDIGASEAGGRPQVFGGVEVLREMDRRGMVAPVIVVTQFEVFGEERMSIRELTSRLAREHEKSFVALVYYDTASDKWKDDFREAIDKVAATPGHRKL